MMLVLKIVISAFIIAAATELAKRQNFWAAILISLPLTSLLSILWLYFETRDNKAVASLSQGILILVPLSLVFFIPFVIQGRTQWPIWLNLSLAIGVTGLFYFAARKLNWV